MEIIKHVLNDLAIRNINMLLLIKAKCLKQSSIED